MPRPTTPAPMTMVLGRCDGTTTDALITDSLHRACPARFSGSDLSRRLRSTRAGQHPSLVAISGRAPRRCKDFLREPPVAPALQHRGRACLTFWLGSRPILAIRAVGLRVARKGILPQP